VLNQRIGTTALAALTLFAASAIAQSRPTIDQFMAPGFPSDLVSAKHADRIAWIANERGRRNVFTAAAPGWRPVRLTSFLADDGVVLTDLTISDDGAIVVFVRGSAPNRDGWVANPSSDPKGPERAIWAARTTGTGAWRVIEGGAPALSPDGRSIALVRDGQILVVPATRARTTAEVDRAVRPTIKAWGRNGGPVWSPDGGKLAFVSAREHHSLIGVYELRARTLRYVSPSVDFDASPAWSPDSRRIAFIRRPGTPYGQQAVPGLQGITSKLPPTAAQRAARTPGSRGPGQAPTENTTPIDGLYRATLPGGYELALMVAPVNGDTGREVWHSEPNGKTFQSIQRIAWAGKSLIFQQEPEEWIRYYAVSAEGGTTAPIELSPGAGALETAGLSPDGETLFYASNVDDIDRRHLWKAPTSGGMATRITRGEGIEMSPAPIASGRQVAALTASGTRPLSVALIDVADGRERVLYPTLGPDFPLTASTVPQPVILKAADGLQFNNQLFLPQDLNLGEKRPAIIFVHGGPSRQMLLGYHYMDFYHFAYAVNQWLTTQGYMVLSVNYRTGIGYGKTFRNAPNSGWQGNAEYQDVLAAGKYLQQRPDVDPARVGIWGLSYGGVLTSQALARNSDLFVAGVDMAGVHLWGPTLDTADVSYQSSAIAAIDGWKSPVLLWHGDDDRNVPFGQTVGLVQLLRQKKVPYELIVVPDDTHETLIYDRWMYLWGRMDTFLDRHLRNRSGARP
jgi:dipeptidyl aminopeptidase/acylaminoacyl peptidase